MKSSQKIIVFVHRRKNFWWELTFRPKSAFMPLRRNLLISCLFNSYSKNGKLSEISRAFISLLQSLLWRNTKAWINELWPTTGILSCGSMVRKVTSATKPFLRIRNTTVMNQVLPFKGNLLVNLRDIIKTKKKNKTKSISQICDKVNIF